MSDGDAELDSGGALPDRTDGRGTVWEWLTGNLETGTYDALRVACGVGAGLLFATWNHGAAARVLNLPDQPTVLEYGTSLWWVALLIGYFSSIMLIAGKAPRVSALSTFCALQLCGGILLNWAGLAIQFTAFLLIFAGGTRPPAWPLRVLQIQLPVGYALAVAIKLTTSEAWRSFEVFQTISQHPMTTYAWPTAPAGLGPWLDVSGLILEGGSAFLLGAGLVWRRRALTVCGVVASVCLHSGISLLLPTGLFLFGVVPFWLAALEHHRVHKQVRAAAGVLVALTAIASAIIDVNPFTVL